MNILLATDGSPFSQAAGNLIARLPWPATRDITVLSVVDQLASGAVLEARRSTGESLAADQLPQTIQEDAQNLVEREAQRFADMGWSTQTLLREGQAADEIVKVAEEIEADVVVMGSRGLGGVKRFLLGSVSQHVMTYAHCSVLITRTKDEGVAEPNPIETNPGVACDLPLRMVLAYDGSPASNAAVDALASLAVHDQTHILITTIMALMTYYRMDVLQTMSANWQAEKQGAQDRLAAVAHRLQAVSPNVSVRLQESADVSQAILDTADEFAADLLVVGHRGLSGIERLLLGSVATRMIHHAPCSVWVMRGPSPAA